jgi:hypothetical protein
MPIQIIPYAPSHVEAVRDFNRRLRDKGQVYFQFPKSPVPEWLPALPGRTLYREFFLALEGADVRGGYILKHQQFLLRGQVASVGNLQLPLSEGIVDARYRLVGFQLLRDALRRQPMLYALGMGGLEKPLPAMLKAAGWEVSAVPFYFRILHPNAFLRNITPLRKSRALRVAADLLAATGIGSVGLKCLHRLQDRTSREGYSSMEVNRFSPAVNEVWHACGKSNPLIASRDDESLSLLYPPEDSRFHRLEIYRKNKLVGWTVLLDSQMQRHNYFGNLRTGSIVDGLAYPEDVDGIVAVASDALAARGVDVTISNQMHNRWGLALRRSGFLAGPSNFILALSPQLAAALKPISDTRGSLHINRGDGDGPIHL